MKRYLPAIVCAVTPLVCYFLIRPYAEIGMGWDDWSYIKSAQVLAQTGHIVYNGWATAMLGWQLYVGALFIKLFGFSFTAVRFSTVIEVVATAYLLQRTCVRAGLNSWNAALVTMTFVLSPLYLPLAFKFLTDIAGILCIVACLYMCLRAVQAQSERAAMLWISFAALVNAVGGTVRQIVWLGLLVMVPCTLWLLRKSRRVLVAGGISWIIGVVFVAAALHWFARQPYSIPTPLFPIRIDGEAWGFLVSSGFRGVLQLALLALPVLLMFYGSIRSWNRRVAVTFWIGFLFLVVSGIALILAGFPRWRLAPFLWNPVTDAAFDRLNISSNQALHLAVLRDSLRMLLTGAVVFGLLCLAFNVFAGPRGRKSSPPETAAISWQKLGILLGSFSAACIVILALTALRDELFFDRYLLPLLAFLLLVLARYYQERVKENLPWACALLIFIFGSFGIAATHDEFALYRGYLSAIDELRSSGVPAEAIFGSPEYDLWTQVEKAGYVNEPRLQVPRGAYVPQPVRAHRPDCMADSAFIDETPALKPAYVVSLSPKECGGQVAFPPVAYHTWTAPHTNWIYALKLPPGFPR
jgi:hypothetical protein